MYIKGIDNNLPKLWKAGEDMLRPLGAKKPYVISIKDGHIDTISHSTAVDKLSFGAKALHVLFMCTVIPPLFLAIARLAYRKKYEVKERVKELEERVEKAALVITKPDAPKADTVTPGECVDQQLFLNKASTYSFLENAAEAYTAVVKDPKWQTPAAKNFLYFEFQRIANELHNLEMNCINEHTLKPIVTELRNSVQKQMAILKPGQKLSLINPQGIENMGNTCYINSALQPILALSNIREYLPAKCEPFPNESKDEFRKRRRIYRAFASLIILRKKGANANEMGTKVAELRKFMFEAALDQGNFRNKAKEGAFADSAEFFDVLIYILGWGIQLKETRVPLDGNDADIPYRITSTRPSQIPVLTTKGSIQGAIDAFSKPIISDADGWKVDVPEFGMEVLAAHQRDTSTLVGAPPEVLILRIEKRVIDPILDGRINVSSMFENAPPSKDATYELVGFCQNHHEVHWTSVVKKDDGWVYCNDSSVSSVKPDSADFRFPANLAIYRKVQI